MCAQLGARLTLVLCPKMLLRLGFGKGELGEAGDRCGWSKESERERNVHNRGTLACGGEGSEEMRERESGRGREGGRRLRARELTIERGQTLVLLLDTDRGQ